MAPTPEIFAGADLNALKNRNALVAPKAVAVILHPRLAAQSGSPFPSSPSLEHGFAHTSLSTFLSTHHVCAGPRHRTPRP